MNKLIEAIDAVDTGYRVVEYGPLTFSACRWDPDPFVPNRRHPRWEIGLHIRHYIDGPEHLCDEYIRTLKTELLELVYGDLKEDLRHLEYAILRNLSAGQDPEIKQALAQLRDKLYYVPRTPK